MFDDDTIAAISTPPGYGGISIIRISGSDAFDICARIFERPAGKTFEQLPASSICHGHSKNEAGETLDEVLVSKLAGPHTYTTQDVAEINCHGGYAAVREVLRLVLRCGARLAQPGEFTKRAFLNGRIDLVQAEAVSDLITSKTEICAKAAVSQLAGVLSETINRIKDDIVSLLMQLEVTIQYPEYDVEDMPAEKLRAGLSVIRDGLTSLHESFKKGEILNEGLKVAIVGKPNVGKSMLLNRLINKEKAIVTDIPGTTRDVVDEYINLRGLPVKIMDTAGIRASEDVVEAIGINRSLETMEKADLILFVVDGSKPPDAEDAAIEEKTNAEKTLVVLNKCDLGAHEAAAAHFSARPCVAISAKTGDNIKKLEGMIFETAAASPEDFAAVAMVTNARHDELIFAACRGIEKAIETLDAGMPVDLAEIDIKDCLHALGMITGEVTDEDIIDAIFANFCLGK